ncbi:hypothetical protein H8N03_00300 [Ramlibacter sp. USB13]|uniref:Uncharacterized protein n=1 Tax=Ramlibacter cellulosilyticus TaxID=2764187 RepID=A0A923S973_9BURK|nr:hypothetical protein [Ramlibacter cellulosilyticus]MBC5781360.1 hypothetical protein [Ramlibacter cellulosilyticus]
MCYLVRQDAVEAEHGAPAPAPGSGRVRSRWAGAAAATLVGGFALAALVAPSPTAPLQPPQQVAAASVTGQRTVQAPQGVVIEQTALPAGDDVPAAPDATRAAIGGCHHGL